MSWRLVARKCIRRLTVPPAEIAEFVCVERVESAADDTPTTTATTTNISLLSSRSAPIPPADVWLFPVTIAIGRAPAAAASNGITTPTDTPKVC